MQIVMIQMRLSWRREPLNLRGTPGSLRAPVPTRSTRGPARTGYPATVSNSERAGMVRVMRQGIAGKARGIVSIKLSYQCLAGGQFSFAEHHEIPEHSICSILIPESLRR